MIIKLFYNFIKFKNILIKLYFTNDMLFNNNQLILNSFILKIIQILSKKLKLIEISLTQKLL